MASSVLARAVCQRVPLCLASTRPISNGKNNSTAIFSACNSLQNSFRPALSFTSSVFASSSASSIRSYSSLSSHRFSARVGASSLLNSSPLSFPSVSARHLHIHEHQALELFAKNDIPTYRFKVATSATDAEQAAVDLKGNDFVVKAQVLTGGRGKGKFTNGYVGGVHTAISPSEVYTIASKMIGERLVTKQSGPEGKPCNKVLVGERVFLRREMYFSILMDRASAGPVMIGSPNGGMDIEKVAAEDPKSIFKENIDMKTGPKDDQITRLVKSMGFSSHQARSAAVDCIKKLYKLFLENDATLVEINPMAETHDYRVLCVDAKVNFDDNAQFRQEHLFKLRDQTQEDPREVTAEKYGLNYIGLDGDIGCIVNGAGLAMATMDAIKLYGGSPANFLDLGGGATKDQVTEAFNLLHGDENVRSILVNIFGGIARCDVIALGLISAATKIGLKKPVVIRLEGTNVKDAVKLIEDSGLHILTARDLGEAAQRVVRITQILKMAEEADISVSFELPI